MGEMPANFGKERLQSVASLGNFNWKTLCRGLAQLPIPA